MSNELQNKIGLLAVDAIKSDLTWDESVAAFGVASKTLATKASTQGDGSKADCSAHATKRFEQSMVQDVDVLTSSRH